MVIPGQQTLQSKTPLKTDRGQKEALLWRMSVLFNFLIVYRSKVFPIFTVYADSYCFHNPFSQVWEEVCFHGSFTADGLE